MDPARNADAYRRACELWRSHIAAEPSSIGLAVAAAQFISTSDIREARGILQRLDVEPANQELLRALARYAGTPAEYARYAQRARSAGATNLSSHIALALAEAGDHAGAEREVRSLIDQARRMLDRHGYKSAPSTLDPRERLSILASRYDWHWAYNVLGLVEAKRGNLDVATEYLEKSLEVEAEFRMTSYGPATFLVEELCHHVRWTEVVRYLDRCASFWPEARKLGWISSATARAMPRLPTRWTSG